MQIRVDLEPYKQEKIAVDLPVVVNTQRDLHML